MRDGLFVRGFESIGDLLCIVEGGFKWERSFEHLAGNQLHHQGAARAGFFNPVYLRNIRMIQRCENFRFALKPCQTLGILCKREG